MSITEGVIKGATSALAEFAIDLGAKLAKKAINGATADDIKQELLNAQHALDAVDWDEDRKLQAKFPEYNPGTDE